MQPHTIDLNDPPSELLLILHYHHANPFSYTHHTKQTIRGRNDPTPVTQLHAAQRLLG